MASPENPHDFEWGYLIRPDKSPSPVLEQLCLGIAKLITVLKPLPTTDHLTPERLSAFYRAVGGNYDSLFLSTPYSSLSFIYQSLGCFHTLQPTANAFEPPTVPALLPHGFVRWQTIQLLLCPDEHAAFLQEAVRKFDIVNPSDGRIFPKDLPRTAFPPLPDNSMVKWHEQVSQRLEREYHARQAGVSPNRSMSPKRRAPQQHQQHHSYPTPQPEGSVAGDSSDYFAQFHRHASRRLRPSVSSRPPSYEAYSPFSHPNDHIPPEDLPGGGSNQSHRASRRRHRDKDQKPRARSRSSKSSRYRQPSPPRTYLRGRSHTPSGLRRSETLSDDSDSGNPDPDDMYSPRYRDRHRHRLSPSETSRTRRHSHDPGYSRRREWNQSPSAQLNGNNNRPKEPYSPDTKHARDFYYSSYTSPFNDPEQQPPSPHRRHLNPNHDNDYDYPPPPSRSSSRRKQKPPPVEIREYPIDLHRVASAPTSPGGHGKSRRRSRSRSRKFFPAFDHPEPGFQSRSASRQGSLSGSGQSRSGSSSERPHTLSGNGRHFPRDVSGRHSVSGRFPGAWPS